nr:ankyrin repeat domain-containing protein 35-like isoform X1 [Physcomitrium patens]|eukprot:XP_024381145.1 ankyrin repeat domain-containing protein 35-like isoform X1 [Physcomitrella patens]
MGEMMAKINDLEEGAYASELHFAVKENDVKRIRILLQEGVVKVTSRDVIGRTPLHWALVIGSDEAAKVLIVNTPRKALDTRDQQGCTPLHYATARAHATMARVLIERGASINAVDSNERTPLHYAALQMSPELVELLISRGASKDLLNVYGESPLDVAQKWGCLSSIPCLTPDPVNVKTTPIVSDKQLMEKVRAGGDKSTVSPVSAEKPTTKTGPSLEKLLGVWKASETEARRKKEAELEAAHKANAALQEALRAWRQMEQESRSQKLVGQESPGSSDACYAKTSGGGDAKFLAGGYTDQASTSISDFKLVDFKGLAVETGASCDEDDSLTSCTVKTRRDLSWCTEWETQESVPEVAQSISPRERKPIPSEPKEENLAWLQVPTYMQTLDLNFDNPRPLKRFNSFDGSHFIIQVGGLATKLPFMSSLEVY